MYCLVLQGGFIRSTQSAFGWGGMRGQSEGVVGSVPGRCCISPSRPWSSPPPHSSPLPAPSLEAAELSTVLSPGGQMSWRNLGCSCLLQQVSKLNMNLSHWKAIFFQAVVIHGIPRISRHTGAVWGDTEPAGKGAGSTDTCSQSRSRSGAACSALLCPLRLCLFPYHRPAPPRSPLPAPSLSQTGCFLPGIHLPERRAGLGLHTVLWCPGKL